MAKRTELIEGALLKMKCAESIHSTTARRFIDVRGTVRLAPAVSFSPKLVVRFPRLRQREQMAPELGRHG